MNNSDFTYKSIFNNLKDRFELHSDKAENEAIIEYIKNGSEFAGTNVWVLILAIFIASVGLNVNSTAVIIGAMLISPLMGPIMGIGLGIGINDLDLIKKAFKNLSIAAIFSIFTSALYFLITPLNEAQSELLARTTPTIWDVIIAFVGGLAGAIAITRKDKSNALPGVAIATALMPPLCTAGYGLANGNLIFFLGAFYLFFINSVFISFSTFLVIRFLKLPKVLFLDREKENRVKKYIFLFVTFTIIPSIYLAYNIVSKSIFESNANQFIKNEFINNKSIILHKDINFKTNTIELLVGGDTISEKDRSTLSNKLERYNISSTKLIIKDSNANIQSELNTIKKSILDDMIRKNVETLEEKDSRIEKLESQLEVQNNQFNSKEIFEELKAQYPSCESLILHSSLKIEKLSDEPMPITIVVIKISSNLTKADKKRINDWLQIRTKSKEMEIFYK